MFYRDFSFSFYSSICNCRNYPSTRFSSYIFCLLYVHDGVIVHSYLSCQSNISGTKEEHRLFLILGGKFTKLKINCLIIVKPGTCFLFVDLSQRALSLLRPGVSGQNHLSALTIERGIFLLPFSQPAQKVIPRSQNSNDASSLRPPTCEKTKIPTGLPLLSP